MAAGNPPAINYKPTSINQETAAISIALFSNPVREVIRAQTIEMIDIVVFINLQGLIQKKVNNDTFSIDMSGLPNGMYVFQNQTTDGIII